MKIQLKMRCKHSGQKQLPVQSVCRNCATQTVGRYCHLCGQDIFAGQGKPLFMLTGQLLENAFALDNKVFVTIKHLIFRPGFLSAEYRVGRINSYVHPVKIFWMFTIIFFALLLSQIDFHSEDDTPKKSASTEQVISQESGATDGTSVSTTKSKGREERKSDKIKDAFSTYAPYVVFLLIPVLALLLALFFWRNRFYYVYHLIFAVHFHAFLWALYSLTIVANIITGETEWPLWVILVVIFLPVLYLIIASYRFYSPRKKRTAAWKSTLIMLLYCMLIIAFLALLGAIFINGLFAEN